MLVLTRRVGESIVMDGDITVTVLAIQGNKIRLGIIAPGHVSVDREEVREKKSLLTDDTSVARHAHACT